MKPRNNAAKMEKTATAGVPAAGLRGYVSFFISIFLLAFFYALLSSTDQHESEYSPRERRTVDAGYDNHQQLLPQKKQENQQQCDWFSGRWVLDSGGGPAYSGVGCSYIHDEVACEKFGRTDLTYQQWRWQPHACHLPRFDPEVFLEKLRNKRMVFVGDSINRNQWVSMICLVESVLTVGRKNRTVDGSLISFKAADFNASIDFYWSPLLVESNCDDPVIHRVENRIMRADAMEKHATHWIDADFLIFNTYLWWKKPNMKMKVLYGSFEDAVATSEENLVEVEMAHGFELALKAWSRWLKEHADTKRTQIYFVSLSPTHVWAGEWGGHYQGSCYNETEPITKEGYTGRGSDYGMMRTAEAVVADLRSSGVNVQILNITQLSEYRKEAHPSVYRRQYTPLTEEQLANPTSYADCTHWCLPGIPDVWNQILYACISSK